MNPDFFMLFFAIFEIFLLSAKIEKLTGELSA